MERAAELHESDDTDDERHDQAQQEREAVPSPLAGANDPLQVRPEQTVDTEEHREPGDDREPHEEPLLELPERLVRDEERDDEEEAREERDQQWNRALHVSVSPVVRIAGRPVC